VISKFLNEASNALNLAAAGHHHGRGRLAVGRVSARVLLF